MALSDHPTQAQLRAQVRLYLMDTSTVWWSDARLNGWIDDWHSELQTELDLVWGTALYSCTSGEDTLTYTSIATDMARPDAFYFNNLRLTPRNEQEMSVLQRDWESTTETNPGVVVPVDSQRMVLWPPPNSQGGYLYAEYPRTLSLSSSTDTSPLPPWTRWALSPYVASRAYADDGPLNDPAKSAYYRAIYGQHLTTLRSIRTKYFPKRYRSVVPGRQYSADILLARRRSPEDPVPPVTFHYHREETPSGTVNGVNATFTLTYTPSPSNSLQLELDTTVLVQGTHYNLSGSTITFVAAYVPQTSQTLYARYRYTS